MSVSRAERTVERRFPWHQSPWQPCGYPGKRALDIVFALVALAVVLPVMGVLAILVKLSSPGPIFYRGPRAGLGGRPFEQLKFRSMVVGTGGGAFTGRDDPRVTRLGKFLRLFKLDELPQFFNVLRGEMSIVGPRPESATVVEKYYTHRQRRVLSTRPGLTCLIQVRAFPDLGSEVPGGVDPHQYYCTTLLPPRLEEDIEYVDTMCLRLDVKLILQTAYCILVKSWLTLWKQRKTRT
ncbi:MAG: sugar transferase, partial [Thermoguttaceae bacterium]